MKRNITQSLLLFAMLIGWASVYAQDFVHNGIGYHYTEEYLYSDYTRKYFEVTSKPEKYTGNINVPKILPLKEYYENNQWVSPWDTIKSANNLNYSPDYYYIEKIGDYAFANSEGLISVSLPVYSYYSTFRTFYVDSFPLSNRNTGYTSSMHLIGNHAFENCKNLVSINIPKTIDTIGVAAFRNCISLKSILLEKSLTESIVLKDSAFYGCTNLKSVTCKVITPPSIPDNAFSTYDTLHVYKGCKMSFYTTAGWKKFKKILDDVEIMMDSVKFTCTDYMRVGEYVEPNVISYYPDYATDTKVNWVGGYDKEGRQVFSVDPNTGACKGLLHGQAYLYAKGNNDVKLDSIFIKVLPASDRLLTPELKAEETDLNAFNLSWNTIQGAKGYEIKITTKRVLDGSNSIINIDGKEYIPSYGLDYSLSSDDNDVYLDTIINSNDITSLKIEHLNYNATYYCSMRALSPEGDNYNSEWGSGHFSVYYEWDSEKGEIKIDPTDHTVHVLDYPCQWRILYLNTEQRYAVPQVVKRGQITNSSIRVMLNRNVRFTNLNHETYVQHFNMFSDTEANYFWKIDYLTVTPNSVNPDAKMDQKYACYWLTSEDLQRGYIDINGLESNSIYDITVWDSTIACKVDACYNILSARTKGVNTPILIKHEVSDTTIIDGNGNASYTPEIFQKYQAMIIDSILTSFMENINLPEDQIFYLEGGKTYVCTGAISLYKGLTLQTNPSDIAAGKGKATLCLGGLNRVNGSCNSSNFLIGRYNDTFENTTIPIFIDTLSFQDIIFDCPQAITYGEYKINSDVSGATGNYFANMYSNGMGVNVNMLHIKGCEFHNFIRGFIRTQGAYEKIFNNILIEDCEFFNNGHYDNKGGGYNWIHGQGTLTSSNVFANVVFRNNTWYNSPRGSLVTNANENLIFDKDVKYNITIDHNTFINFQPGSGASALIGTRYVPGGSKFTIKDNLFVLTKRAEDTDRPLNFCGGDLRGVQGADGSNKVIVDISNNYSTKDNISATTGQVFTKEPFNSKKYGFLSYADLTDQQKSDLVVTADDIYATELFAQPNPPYNFDATTQYKAYACSCIDGSKEDEGMVNLYYNDSAKVRNSIIYTQGIGASKWREGIGHINSISNINAGISESNELIGIYSANGTKQSSLQHGINILRYADGSAKKIIK